MVSGHFFGRTPLPVIGAIRGCSAFVGVAIVEVQILLVGFFRAGDGFGAGDSRECCLSIREDANPVENAGQLLVDSLWACKGQESFDFAADGATFQAEGVQVIIVMNGCTSSSLIVLATVQHRLPHPRDLLLALVLTRTHIYVAYDFAPPGLDVQLCQFLLVDRLLPDVLGGSLELLLLLAGEVFLELPPPLCFAGRLVLPLPLLHQYHNTLFSRRVL